ncbi:unnamed protein product [Caenorhabditis angaria]|uniref:Uncharacterized protein n=1 Tax=Caenorhabditis angaria TaxID=860376 RepID=A0A9P1MVK9_9PELO|nr:unnamed protein product [Caenorhabditis angaria]
MSPTNESCELAYDVVNHPAYRIAQVFTFLVSVCAMIVLLNFISRKLFKSVFHANLKSLLCTYFSMNFHFSLTMAIAFGYHTIQPFFANSKCDLFINHSLFKYIHLAFTFTLTTPMLFTISISIERTIAIIKAHNYEKLPMFIGPLLAILTIVSGMIVTFWAYQNEPFDEDLINFILIPSASVNNVNHIFQYFIILDVITFIFNLILLKITRDLNKKENRRRTLSVRFQMEQIMASNKFTIYIFFVHLLFTVIYLSTVLSLWTIGKQYIFTTYTGYTTKPLFSLIIGLVATAFLKTLKIKRKESLRTTIRIAYSGKVGAMNHDNAIFEIWNTYGGHK